ncbi:MAG: Cna B-type domain-containing protein [Erysipelotrichaceae bacterium]|nr:Cna B-type domain-containing protein [Erysipelotrichaceae bacterium]
MKKLLSILIALFICFGSVVTAFAADNEFEVSGSKTADPTFLTGDERETTVTLSLPSAEYQNEIDIVFSMDSSTSAQNSTVFLESVNELFDSILENNPNLKLKVGVIRFRGRAHDAVKYVSDGAYEELVVYDDDSKQYIEAALNMTEDEIKAAFGSGSNTHGGIDIANEWLKADTEVDDDHKYLVLLTDAKTYIWNNDDHEPTTIYSQWYRSNSYAMQNSGKPALNQIAGYNKYDYAVDVLDPTGKSNVYVFKPDTLNSAGKPDWTISEAYQKLYDSTDEELTGVTKWDQYCRYADDKTTPDGSVVKHNVTNGADLFGSNSATYGNRNDYKFWFEYTPNEAWEGVTYLEANPFLVTENADGTYTFDTESVNPDYYLYHVDCLQKGMYKAGHLWTEVGEKYHCAVITYSGGSVSGGLELRVPFIEWLHENTEFAADISTSSQVEALFEGIDNDIRYMVSKGVVTDQITDDFTLKNDDNENAFRMTLSGESLPVTYEDGKWYFGTADDEGVYPYVIEYDPDTKTITWTINVPVENSNPVTLSYDLILREDAESAIYPTNVSAVLDYVSTDGKYEGEYEFPIPEVVYIRLIDIDVEKVWEDNDNEEGARPDSVTAVLLADGEELDSQDLSEDNEWHVTFEDLPDSTYEDGEFTEITYTLQEVEVPDYTTEITEEEENYYVITNTFVPRLVNITITKVWEDNENEAGKRPDSVTVTLLADGEEYESYELSDENEWTVTLEDMREGNYVEGEFTAIEYTVEEDEVEEYEAEITDDGEYNFTVTNTYTPPTPPTGGPETMALGLMMMSTSLTGMYQVYFTAKRRKEEE